MKIQIISDLHQEFGVTELLFDHADVVILAGDVNLGTKGVEWIKTHIPNKPVIYVLGNHEYYKGSYPKTLNKIIKSYPLFLPLSRKYGFFRVNFSCRYAQPFCP